MKGRNFQNKTIRIVPRSPTKLLGKGISRFHAIVSKSGIGDFKSQNSTARTRLRNKKGTVHPNGKRFAIVFASHIFLRTIARLGTIEVFCKIRCSTRTIQLPRNRPSRSPIATVGSIPQNRHVRNKRTFGMQ